jgi:two-component system, NarL family, response regulator DevR
MSQRIDVFLLTENRLLREALMRIFGGESDLVLVGAAAFSPQLVKEVAASRAHVLLSDAGLNSLADLQIIPELRKELPDLRVLLIGMESDPSTFLRAVRAGVVGYVLKDASSIDVATAVRAIARNEAVCPPSLCRVLFEHVAGPQTEATTCLQARHPFGLTRREQQLVEMMGRGLTNKEIANRLNLSDQTVKNHVHRVLQKVGAGDRLEAAEICRTGFYAA